MWIWKTRNSSRNQPDDPERTDYRTGARVSELIRMKVEHVQIGYFDIYTKGGKIPRIYIPKSLRKEATEWHRSLPLPAILPGTDRKSVV